MSSSVSGSFWRQRVESLYPQYGTGADGLCSAEAARKLGQYGPNIVVQDQRSRLLGKIARKFAEPLVAILLMTGALSAATGDPAGFAIINRLLGDAIADV
ncbi:MAG: cation-transporting P-type ATPase [Variibacter sp.]